MKNIVWDFLSSLNIGDSHNIYQLKAKKDLGHEEDEKEDKVEKVPAQFSG